MNFLEKLKRFMAGRYGFDQFGRFLFYLSFVFWVLCFICRFLPFYKIYFVFSLLNTIIYVYAFFRIFSKNIYARQLENEKYTYYCGRIVPVLNKKKREVTDKNYVYKLCPRCKVKLRLKRVKGKHMTQCPKCGKKFKVRVFIDHTGEQGGTYYY